jgi:MerR family transcriptional regulator, heat shock protein HspR
MTTTQRFLEPSEHPAGWSWSRDAAGRPATDRSGAAGTGAASTGAAGTAGARGASSADAADPVDQSEHARRQEDDLDLDTPLFVISIAAEMSELHPQTLRAYERDGLLEPFRTPGGTRRYSRRDVERLRLIRRLTQDEGLNLAGVRLVLDLGEKLEGARRRVGELEELVRILAERIEQRPASDRFEIVKAPAARMEVHRSSRRTGSRGTPAPMQRARPLLPPELRATTGS